MILSGCIQYFSTLSFINKDSKYPSSLFIYKNIYLLIFLKLLFFTSKTFFTRIILFLRRTISLYCNNGKQKNDFTLYICTVLVVQITFLIQADSVIIIYEYRTPRNRLVFKFNFAIYCFFPSLHILFLLNIHFYIIQGIIVYHSSVYIYTPVNVFNLV